MALFNIIIDIAAKTANIEAGVKLVEQKFDHLGEMAKKTGELLAVAFTADYFKEMILGAVESGDAMAKAAQKAGTAVEQFSALAYAAKQTDVSLESLSNSVKFMQKAIADNDPTITQLGVHLADLQGLTSDQQLEVFADAIAGINDPAQRTAAALKIFGRAGTDLLPLLDQGADGIRRFIEEAKNMGVTLTNDSAEALKEADEAVKKLSASWSTLWQVIAVGAVRSAEWFGVLDAPELKTLNKELDELVKRRHDLYQQLDALQGNGKTNLEITDETAVINKNLSMVEDKMNEVNKKMLELQSSSTDLTPITVTAKHIAEPATLEHWFNPQTKQEMEEGFDYLDAKNKESLEEAKKDKQDQADFFKYLDSGVSDWFSETLDQSDRSIKEYSKKFESSYKDMSEYAKQAARSIESYMADFFFDPFKDGLSGMLKGFIDVIRRIVAELAAANLAKYLFGGTDSSGASTSGAASSLLTSFLNLFKADGGPVSAGSPYIVGERGPELFTPGTSGFITPNAALAGGGGAVHMNTVNNFYSGSDDQLRRQLPAILDQQQRSTLAQVQDMKRRGKL